MRTLSVLLSALVMALASFGSQAALAADAGRSAATVTLLPGSTLTASAAQAPVRPAGPEHLARSTPLTGTLRAKGTGGFGPRVDLIDVPFRGSIAAASFARDPLCPAAAPPPRFDVVAPSEMQFSITGTADWSLVIKGSGSQLFGCGPAGPLTGRTSILLRARRIDTAAMVRRGRTEPRELKRLSFTGTVPDITLPDGTIGKLTASVVAKVSLGRQR